MLIRFDKSWCEGLTPCPFREDTIIRVGDFDCYHCEHCLKIQGDLCCCMHPEGDGLEFCPPQFYKRHVTVISHDIETGRVVEEHYYKLSKTEAIERFLNTHTGIYKSKAQVKAFYPYEYEREAWYRNRRFNKSSKSNALRYQGVKVDKNENNK